MFATGAGLLTQEDRVTEDGLQEVFETNVFGHFIMVKVFSGNYKRFSQPLEYYNDLH